MITKGNSTTGRHLAAHLLKEENDRIEVLDIRGAAVHDLAEAIDDWREFSKGTQCQKPLYHAQLNPDPNDRNLSREDWEKIIGIFEKEMGLEGYPRAVVMHEKHGREHVHLVYSRFNPELEQEKLRAWSDSWNYRKNEEVSRRVERELGLIPTKGVHVEREGPRPERTPELWEMQRGQRSGIDPRTVKADLTELWQSTDSGKAFAAAAAERGYILAQGDRRDFVVIDPAGDEHNPARRISGAKAADIRERFKDIDREKLPTVEEAQEQQREAQEQQRRERGHRQDAEPPRTPKRERTPKEKPLNRTEERIKEAAREAESGNDLVNSLNEAGFVVARVTGEDIQKRDRDQVAAIIQSQDAWMLQAGGVAGLTPEQLESAERSYSVWDYREKYDFGNYVGYTQKKWAERVEECIEKYGSLEAFAAEIERDDTARLLLPYKIKAGDFIALNQYGHVYKLDERTTGHDAAGLLMSADFEPPSAAQAQQEQRETWERGELQRADAKEFYEARAGDREIAAAYREADKEIEALDREIKAEARDIGEGIERGAGAIGTVAATVATSALEKVADLAGGFLESIFAPPNPARDDPAQQADRMLARRQAARARSAAMEHLADRLKQGEDLKREDLHGLPAEEIRQYEMNGDDYVKDLVRQHQEMQRKQEQEKRRDWGY